LATHVRPEFRALFAEVVALAFEPTAAFADAVAFASVSAFLASAFA